MKRRKAIGTLILAGGAAAAGAGGYDWFTLTKKPNKEYLLHKKNLLEDLAETIIPATGTPGAKEAGAVDYMMRLLTECTDTKTLNRFIEGLQDLEKFTLSKFRHSFTECSSFEKEQVLTHFEERNKPISAFIGKVKRKFTGSSFFDTLKEYTVYGYCTSEKGASLGMRYIAVPGKYLSCIPLEPDQKAWATK